MKTDELIEKDEYKKLIPRPSEHDYEEMKKDAKTKGITEPIEINKNNIILDGHTRYDIAKELDIKEVPTRVINLKSELEEKEYGIRKNLLRRHLNNTQKAKIGLSLLEIEEEKAKQWKEATIPKKGEKGFQNRDKDAHVGKILSPHAKDSQAKKSADIVAKEVGISSMTIKKAKKIKQTKFKNKVHQQEVDKAWNEAESGKKGSIDSVYKKVKKFEDEEKGVQTPIVTTSIMKWTCDCGKPYQLICSGGELEITEINNGNKKKYSIKVI